MEIACVGSRDVPFGVKERLLALGGLVVYQGHVLRTGNAPGADQAFAAGGNAQDPAKVHLFLPWEGFEFRARRPGNRVVVAPDPEVDPGLYQEAERLHPRWDLLDDPAKRLMARNVLTLRGAAMCLAWPNWQKQGGGGTGQALRYCQAHQVPLIDLTQPDSFLKATAWLQGVA